MAGIVVLVVAAGAVLGIADVTALDAGRLELARQTLGRVLGSRIVMAGAVQVAVFPRPEIVAKDVEIETDDGTLAITVPTLRGTLSLLPLLSGRLVLSTVHLVNPTGTLDVDRLAAPLRPSSDANRLPSTRAGTPLPDKVTVTSGLLQIRSSNPAASGLVTDFHAVLDGLDGAAAKLSGGAAWHGERGDFSARLDSLAAFVDGRETGAFVKLRSRLITASIGGVLAKGWRGRFNGAVSVSSPSLPAVLRLTGLDNAADVGIQHASLTGTAEAGDDGVAMADAKLMVNDVALEGSLAWQQGGGRSGLMGTLATDLLDLDPLVSVLPDLRDADGRWSRATLLASTIAMHDVDLRISANRLKLDTLETQDAALSVLYQDGRMELSLGEARAYGGLVKGRLFASRAGPDLDVKVDASWSRLNLGQMSGVFATSPDQISGFATGHLTAEGRGPTVGAIVQSTGGHGQISLRQARLAGLPFVDALLHPDTGAANDNSSPAATPIDLASLDFQVAQGMMTIAKGSIAGPDLHIALRGQTSLPQQSYLLTSTVTDDSATEAGTPGAASSNLIGRWGGPISRFGSTLPKGPSPASASDATPFESFFP